MATIKINNWTEFNPRKDGEDHHWFRVDNTIPFSRALDGLTAEQKWFWVCLLSFVSKANGEPVEYDVPYFEKHVGLSKKKMDQAIAHLRAKGVITFSAVTERLPVGDHAVTERCPTDGRTNETDETYGQHKPAALDSFDTAFKEFPVRAKGGGAEKRFAEQIRTSGDLEDLMAALRHYRQMLALPENDWRSPKQSFAAFLGTKSSGYFWRDFIDPASALPTKTSAQHISDDEFADQLIRQHHGEGA